MAIIILILYMGAGKISVYISYLILIICVHFGCMYTPIQKHLKKQFSSFGQKAIYNDTNLNLEQYLYCISLISYLNPSIDTTPVFRYINNQKIKDTIIRGNEVSYNGFIFFKNGFCIKGKLYEKNKGLIYGDYFEIDSVRLDYSNSIGSCGFYEILGDTVKVKTLSRDSYLAGSVYATEEWYRLKDKSLVQLLYFKDLTWEHNYPSGLIPNYDSVALTFSKKYQINKGFINPNSSWLINKSWFWYDKKEYLNWKNENKNRNNLH
ncbi:MAG: hypothetical protein IPP32_16700 [Bacteroidetes bacterium]|nr:hypothetical protein [Bacteroidota bacterium]